MDIPVKRTRAKSKAVLTYRDIRNLERKHGLLPKEELTLFAWLSATGLGKGSLPSLRIFQAFRTHAKDLSRGYRRTLGAFRQEAKVSPDEAYKRLGVKLPGKRKDRNADKAGYHREHRVTWLRTPSEEPIAERLKAWKAKKGPTVAAFLKEQGIPPSRFCLLSVARRTAIVSLPYETVLVTLPLPPKDIEEEEACYRYTRSDSAKELNIIWHVNTAPLPLPG